MFGRDHHSHGDAAGPSHRPIDLNPPRSDHFTQATLGHHSDVVDEGERRCRPVKYLTSHLGLNGD